MSKHIKYAIWFVLILTFVLAANTLATPNVFVTDTSLYLEIGSATAFNVGAKSDLDSSAAVLPIRIRSTDSAWSTQQVLNMTIVIEYNPDSLVFDTAMKTDSWGGTFAVYDTAFPTGRLTLAFRAGAVPLTGTFTHFADVVFYPQCRPEGTTTNVPFSLNYRTWIVNRSTGDSHVPTAGHCTSGTITTPQSTATFSIPHNTVSDSRGRSIPVYVLSTTNNRYQGYKTWIRYNSSKLHIDSVVVRGSWVWWGINLTKTDTIVVEPTDFYPHAEATADTMYTIWLTTRCGTAMNDSAVLTPILSKLVYLDYPCFVGIGPEFTGDTITLRDSAELRAYLPSAAEVSRQERDTIRFNLQLKNSFKAGVQYTGDTGVTMCVRSGTPAFDIIGLQSLTAGLDWDYHTSGSTDSFGVFQNGVDTIPVTTTLTDRVGIDFEWIPTLYTSVNWNVQYIKPTFLQRFNGFTTIVPSTACSTLVARSNPAEVKYGSFADSIKVRMAQVGTNTVSGSPCVWQTVRIRANFNIDSLSVVMQVPSNAVRLSSESLLSGISIESLGGDRYRIVGNVAISAGTTYTDLARFRLEPKYCTSGIVNQNISLTKVSDSIYSNTSPLTLEFGTPLDAGTATALYRCFQISCGDIGDPIPTDVDNATGGLPTDFALSQNYPNPFNPTTTISLALPVASDWHITIINVSGQVVKRFDGNSGPGIVTVQWDADDYASGVYLYRAEAGQFVETKKMMLLR